jgi:hypothetical protein
LEDEKVAVTLVPEDSNDSENTDYRPPQRLSLFHRGDFIVVLGTQEVGQLEVTISSDVLSIASPVWSVLCRGGAGGSFRESIEQKAEFPEDDPDMLLLLLRIAHLDFRNVPPEMDSDQIYELSILCNKYDCTMLVKPWIRSWMEPFREEQENWSGEARFALTAWVFGDTKTYEIMAQRIMTVGIHGETPGTLVLSPEEKLEGQALPEGFIGNMLFSVASLFAIAHDSIESILRARELMLDRFFAICDQFVATLSSRQKCTHCDNEGCRALCLGNFVQGLIPIDFWPSRPPLHKTPNLNEMKTRLSKLHWDKFYYKNGRDRVDYCTSGSLGWSSFSVEISKAWNSSHISPVSPSHMRKLDATNQKLGLFEIGGVANFDVREIGLDDTRH